MKTIFALTVVALVLGSPVAFAADDHRDAQRGADAQGHARPQEQGRQQSQPRAQERSRPQAQPRIQEQPRAQVQARPQSQPRSQAQVVPQRQQRSQPSRVTAAPANNAGRGIASQNQVRGSVAGSREGSVGGARANVDIHAYQRNVSSAQRFQAGSYRAPQGYSYRRWSWGQRLPAIYFGRDYWLNNYASYGLFAPPDGLVWVRFGPDALLIDGYSGEIVQVDYGVFY
jgi:Ni/Co efflux regulator RcnB